LNDISRNSLLGNRKKIAKFLMRTFACRSTFLYDYTPPPRAGSLWFTGLYAYLAFRFAYITYSMVTNASLLSTAVSGTK